MKGEKDQEILFNTWDLGGQIVFYPTHQFFLTNGAIYVLTFNYENAKLPRIEYWMKLIKLLGQEESTIVMVGTHAENCTNEHIQNTNELLQTKFPKHKYSAFFIGLEA